MPRLSNPFRAHFTEPYNSVMAVYKATFRNRYLILKCKALHSHVANMSIDLDRRLRNGVTNPKDIYLNAIDYIKKAHVNLVEITVLSEHTDPAELLIAEHKALKAASKDPACLNTSFLVTTPQWIPQTAVAAYKEAIKPKPRAKKKTGFLGSVKKSGTRTLKTAPKRADKLTGSTNTRKAPVKANGKAPGKATIQKKPSSKPAKTKKS